MVRFLAKLKLTKITTEAYFWIVILSLGILYLVFDTALATVYHIILAADFILYYFNYRSDKVIQFPLEKRTDNRLKSILTAVIAYGGFLIISTLFLAVASPQSVVGVGDFMGVIKLMSTSVPIFAGSLILSIYSFGFIVASIESSLFFGRFLEKVKSIVEKETGKIISPHRFSSGWIYVIITCMSAFVLYHLGSKGLANVPLMITGIFAVISCILVIKDGELKSAILLHIINNVLIILTMFNVF